MPRIITARQLDLRFQNVFGELGPEVDVTIHHAGGPTDDDLPHAIRLDRAYHEAHARKGWGGAGYHFNITRGGVIICLRPTILKGAHVGDWNTGNIGILFHGTTGDRPTQAQVVAFRWLLVNAHTRKMPAAHRTDRPLNKPHTRRRGHNDWPGHESNACPGTHKPILNFKTR